jgi:hypothetical protein
LVDENRVLCLDEIFEITTEFINTFTWTSHNLELLCQEVSKIEGIIRIDLPIPFSKPLPIFKGHHNVKTATYFILEATNQDLEIERAKSHLLYLTQSCLQERLNKQFI